MTSPIIEPTERARPRLSLVWIIPLLALAVALATAWSSFSQRGPVIEVSFPDASGITVGETKLKYLNVDVGIVEDIAFSDDLAEVLVKIRVDKEVADFVDKDSAFWIVEPRVTPRGVSGLQTVLGGVYIRGSWDSEKGDAATRFAGLAEPPATEFGVKGLRIILRATDGNQIAAGAPILFKGIEVGKIQRARLSTASDAVLFDAFIEAPHDRLVTSATRFWDASGVSFSLGAGGAKVDIESLAALVGGGVSFDTIISGGRKPQPGAIFDLFKSEDDVRNNLFSRTSGQKISYAIEFDGTVSGLTTGAPVEFRGIKIGEVASISAEFTDGGDEISSIRLVATVDINPKALGLEGRASEATTTAFLTTAVEGGLRARLARASLLTGGLKVEFAELEAPEPASITRDLSGMAILPSVAVDIAAASASAEGMFQRINDLPIEELVSAAVTLLNSINTIANDPDVKRTPAEIYGLIADARGVVSSEKIAGLPDDIGEIAALLKKSAGDIERLTQTLANEDTVADLRQAIKTVSEIVADVKDGTSGFPGIVTQIEALANSASKLPIDELVASTSGLIKTVDTFAGSDAMKDLPPALTAALDEIRELTATIRSGDLVENATKTFASTQTAADTLATSMEQLPALIAKLNRAATQAQQTLASYDEGSRLPDTTRTTLREIQKAAAAVSSLARKIERNPNSLITGR